jgi:hypothetical protein
MGATCCAAQNVVELNEQQKSLLAKFLSLAQSKRLVKEYKERLAT